MNDVWGVLAQLSRLFAFFGPINLVCIYGMILAINRIKSYGKPAMLVAIGAGLIFTSFLLFVVSMTFIMPAIRSSNTIQISAKTQEGLPLLFWSLTTSVGMSLILWAAFTGRMAPPRLDD